jgi:6-phosphogluconolactonase (cycloisomerase 2 family)
MVRIHQLVSILILLIAALFLSNCGGAGSMRLSSPTGAAGTTGTPSGSGSGSGSGSSSGSGTGSSNSIPGFGEGTGAAGQTSAAHFLYADPVPGGGPFAQAIQSNGTLTPANSVLANNQDPQTMAIDPSGSFLYQTALEFNNAQGGIFAYTIDRSSGSLTQISGSPYLANISFFSDAVDQRGKFLFAQGPNGVYAFSITPATGGLTQVPGSPFSSPTPTIVFTQPANRMGVDQTNNFLYVSTNGGIVGYTINQSSGQLTAIAGSPFGADVNNPFAIVVAPSNKFLYETHSANDTNLYGYSIDQTTGALTPLAGSPFNKGQCGTNTVSTSGSPDNMTIASAGKFLYLANCGTYSIDPNSGALAQVSNFVPGDWPVIDPTGDFLWALTQQEPCFHCEIGVTTYQVDPNTGGLTAVPNSFFSMTNSEVGSVTSLAITK